LNGFGVAGTHIKQKKTNPIYSLNHQERSGGGEESKSRIEVPLMTKRELEVAKMPTELGVGLGRKRQQGTQIHDKNVFGVSNSNTSLSHSR
jgi:hypothetical protein